MVIEQTSLLSLALITELTLPIPFKTQILLMLGIGIFIGAVVYLVSTYFLEAEILKL
jgi:hypothetical protein